MSFQIQLVTDRPLSHLPFLQMIEESLKGGVDLVQLREKELSTREFMALGEQVLKITKKYGVPLIINDRLDVVQAISAQGVHLGQSDMPYHHARRLLGPDKIIGVSIENEDNIFEANQYSDIDYLGVGPIFETSTKKDCKEFLGIERLLKIQKMTSHRLVAIGGIHLNNISLLKKTGICGAAIVSAICSSSSPKETVQQLKQDIYEDSF